MTHSRLSICVSWILYAHELHERGTLFSRMSLYPQGLKQRLLRNSYSTYLLNLWVNTNKNVHTKCISQTQILKINFPGGYERTEFFSAKQAQEGITSPSPQWPDTSPATSAASWASQMTHWRAFLGRSGRRWWLTKITTNTWSIIKPLSVGWTTGADLKVSPRQGKAVSILPAQVVIKHSRGQRVRQT